MSGARRGASRLRNRRSSSTPRSAPWDALVFQGGGSLGAYECGVFESFAERGFDFDILGGVSIGAANAAIVASHGRDAATHLGRFWDDLADPLADVATGDEAVRRRLSGWKSVVMGNPAMFIPRWVREPWGLPSLLSWTSLYDPSPYRQLLEKHVDFAALRRGPRRLLVTALDVQSGELSAFDSAETPITVDHLMASGALPPAFPAVRIGDRSYWDGGIVSNTPARKVLQALPVEAERRMILIELFPRQHHVPKNLLEVMATLKDLTYMDRLELDAESTRTSTELRHLLEELLGPLSPGERKRCMEIPEYHRLLTRHRHHVEVYVLTHRTEEGELDAKDYDFSTTSLRKHRSDGRHAAREAVERWEARPEWVPFTGHEHPAGGAPPGGRPLDARAFPSAS